jgi:hypothetical protein
MVAPGRDHRGMSPAEPVTALVELVLEPDGVHGVLRAQHTPDLPFSGWLGLAVAVDRCRRAADDPAAIDSKPGGTL